MNVILSTLSKNKVKINASKNILNIIFHNKMYLFEVLQLIVGVKEKFIHLFLAGKDWVC